MKKLFAAFCVLSMIISCDPVIAQIKVCQLPQTTIGTLDDYLIKEDSTCVNGTRKISVRDFLTFYGIGNSSAGLYLDTSYLVPTGDSIAFKKGGTTWKLPILANAIHTLYNHNDDLTFNRTVSGNSGTFGLEFNDMSYFGAGAGASIQTIGFLSSLQTTIGSTAAGGVAIQSPDSFLIWHDASNYFYMPTKPGTAGQVLTTISAHSAHWTSLSSTGITAGDTAAMLNTYLHDFDTTAMLNTYLHKYDTTAMLSTYLHRYDTTAMLNDYIRNVGNLSPLWTATETSHNVTFLPVSQSANKFYASPDGSSGNPAFRSIVAADLPSLSGIGIVPGDTAAMLSTYLHSAANLSGTGIGLWKNTSSHVANFKRLKAGSNITIVDNTDSISIAEVADTFAIEFIIDGGGSAITTGIKGDLEIPFDCTIIRSTLLADQTGSIVVQIWKDLYANFPPDVSDAIYASAPPTISSATKSQDATLTGWTTSITSGQILRFNVSSVTDIQRCTISLKCIKN